MKSLVITLSAFTALAFGQITVPGSTSASKVGPPNTAIFPPSCETRTQIRSLPFSITNSGSYVVTGNLSGISSLNGITIDADDVSLDLAGFSLVGSGGASGILVENGHVNIEIGNGTLRGWSEYGVDAQTASLAAIRNIAVRNNGEGGARIGEGATLNEVRAWDNGSVSSMNGFGIQVASGYLAQCTSRENSHDGFVIGNETQVESCVSGNNGRYGFQLNDQNWMHNCTAISNPTAIHTTANNNRIELVHTAGIVDIATPGNFLRGISNTTGGFLVVGGNSYGQVLQNPGPEFSSDQPHSNFEF